VWTARAEESKAHGETCWDSLHSDRRSQADLYFRR
jgi:hypothetical protein